MKKILDLFRVFFKIGAFTFGGGYAMIPIIQKEVVDNKKWITDEDILNIVAIAESTPGPIAINSATFIGYKVAGVFGSVAATLGVVLPSFVVISIIAFFLGKFSEYKPVQYAFYGIRAGVLALVIKALITMYKKMPKTALAYGIAIFAFVAAVVFDVLEFNIIYVILACAVIGLISSLFKIGGEEK